MHPDIERWVFVTGAPRSGTTFVGTVLAGGLRTDYIHEPFNPDCGIAGVEDPWLYLEEGEPRELCLRPAIERLLDYREPLRTGFYPNDTPLRRVIKRVVGSRGPFNLRLARMNVFRNAAVIKDPVGCLLAEHLVQRYGMKAVVMLREPEGFVASVKRLGWQPRLEPLLAQPRFVTRFLTAEDRDVAATFGAGTVVERAALLWRLLNRALLAMAEGNAAVLMVRHESIGEEALATFAAIFAHAGIVFDTAAERRVLRATGGHRAGARARRVQDFHRDSRAIRDTWRAVLDADEIARVRRITAPVRECLPQSPRSAA